MGFTAEGEAQSVVAQVVDVSKGFLSVKMRRRECHSEDQDEKDSFYVEDVSQRGAEKAETSVSEVQSVQK